MKQVVSVVLLLLIFTTVIAQPKTRGKVRRKYRKAEQVTQYQPQAVFRGLVRDTDKMPIAGASVEVESVERLVHTNENGEFTLTGLPVGRLRIKIASHGYQTKLIDYALGGGFNDHYIALDRISLSAENTLSTAQKREQRITDIPMGVSTVNSWQVEKLNIRGAKTLADYYPLLNHENTGAGSTGFSMSGASLFTDLTGISSSLSVYSDGVPIISGSSQDEVFFDVDRIEVIRGPQNVLFGANAAYGAVHVVNKKPDFSSNGVVSVTGGNYGHLELRGRINRPLVEDKIAMRAAAIYNKNNGYISNLHGRSLNGYETRGGRLAFQILPAFDHSLDVTINYLNYISTGTDFINPRYTDMGNESGLKEMESSLNRGSDLGSNEVIFDTGIQYRYYFDAHKYLSFTSSYRTGKSTERRDADGTSLAAFEIDKEAERNLIYNEISYSYSVNSRLHGSVGLKYQIENGNDHFYLSSSDSLIREIMAPTNNALSYRMGGAVNNSTLSGSVFQETDKITDQHNEELIHENTRNTAQAFIHFTYQLRPRWFLTGGITGIYAGKHLLHQSVFSDGEPSTMGANRNTAPNILFQPTSGQEISDKAYFFTGLAGINYRWNEKLNVYGNISRGRKPQLILFTYNNRPIIEKAEIIYNIEGGWKWELLSRVFWDGHIFYRKHQNIQLPQWSDSAGTDLILSGGKGISSGVETGLSATVIPGFEIYGRYSRMYSKFDSLTVDGNDFIYAGKRFAWSPEHSFTVGVNVQAKIVKGLILTANPWFSYKSHFWFTPSNDAGLDQPDYGVLNAQLGFRLEKKDIALKIYATNLLDERYISSAGHIGGIVGLPTIIRGLPRMAGVIVAWDF